MYEHEPPYGPHGAYRRQNDRTGLSRRAAPWRSVILVIDEDYEIVSVEPTDPPRDMVGTGWHCYVIEQGSNRIRGYQQGSIKSVTQAVQEIVIRLNERRYGRKGRVQLTMSTRGKKPRRE